MKKSLVLKIARYCDSTDFPYSVYFTDVVPALNFAKYKYFFKYHNTHGVAESFKTQKDIEKFIDENITIKCYITSQGKETRVGADYLENVPNITDIEYVEEIANGQELKVKYYNGDSVYYENVHGSWGFPTLYNNR